MEAKHIVAWVLLIITFCAAVTGLVLGAMAFSTTGSKAALWKALGVDISQVTSGQNQMVMVNSAGANLSPAKVYDLSPQTIFLPQAQIGQNTQSRYGTQRGSANNKDVINNANTLKTYESQELTVTISDISTAANTATVVANGTRVACLVTQTSSHATPMVHLYGTVAFTTNGLPVNPSIPNLPYAAAIRTNGTVAFVNGRSTAYNSAVNEQLLQSKCHIVGTTLFFDDQVLNTASASTSTRTAVARLRVNDSTATLAGDTTAGSIVQISFDISYPLAATPSVTLTPT